MTAQTPGTQDGAKLADTLELQRIAYRAAGPNSDAAIDLECNLLAHLDEIIVALRHPPAAVAQDKEINDALDLAECAVHDKIADPAEREWVKGVLQKLRVAQGTREEPVCWMLEGPAGLTAWNKGPVKPDGDVPPSFKLTPLYAAPPRGTPEQEQIAWLIEMPAARWGTGYCWGGPEVWTSIEHAIRFARKEDAEAIIETLKVYNRKGALSIEYEACEHLWVDAAGRR